MDLALHLRSSANAFLSQYEPIALLAAPLLAFLLARALHSAVSALHDKGLAGLLTSLIRLIPGVGAYIEAEKKKVVDKLQSGNKSEKDSWRTELPGVGLGRGALEELDGVKKKDVAWQGRCSGTVYIGGSESEGHFSLTNEAYSICDSPARAAQYALAARVVASLLSLFQQQPNPPPQLRGRGRLGCLIWL